MALASVRARDSMVPLCRLILYVIMLCYDS